LSFQIENIGFLIEWLGYGLAVEIPGIAAAVAGIVCSVLLLYGTFQNRPRSLIPWMVVEFFSTIVFLILATLVAFVLSSYESVVKEHVHSTGNDIAADPATIGRYIFASSCIAAAINFYFIWVVRSFYKELKDEGTGQMNGKV
jgi:hypothetical protein